jgi:regulator of replication initiation timing
MEPNLETKIMKTINDIVELKVSLRAKENELQNLIEENELQNLIEENEMLKTRMSKKEKKRV